MKGELFIEQVEAILLHVKSTQMENIRKAARMMADEPMTLQEIGDHFNISRERARQIEKGLTSKIMKDLAHSLRKSGFDKAQFSA